jgi:hypothetical protein
MSAVAIKPSKVNGRIQRVETEKWVETGRKLVPAWKSEAGSKVASHPLEKGPA